MVASITLIELQIKPFTNCTLWVDNSMNTLKLLLLLLLLLLFVSWASLLAIQEYSHKSCRAGRVCAF